MAAVRARPPPPGNQAIAVHDIVYCIPSAQLFSTKSAAVYDPSATGLFAIPGNDVTYTITTTNLGAGSVDADSILIVDDLPTEVEFYNGDIDGAGPLTEPVAFIQSGAGLTFSAATDLGFSNSVTAPANFSACNYVPSPGYDPTITFVCFNPKGAHVRRKPRSLILGDVSHQNPLGAERRQMAPLFPPSHQPVASPHIL